MYDFPIFDPMYWEKLLPEIREPVLKILLACICGALIGWERGRLNKAAGLRTHTLISLGSCLFTLIGIELAQQFSGDPLRILQGIILGIGFLSGGVIVNQGASVRGLTTAAGLWVLTAIGMASGLGYYFYAIFGTIVTFFINIRLLRIEKSAPANGTQNDASDSES